MAKDKKNKKEKKKMKKQNKGLKFLAVLLTVLIIVLSIILIGYNYILENFLSEIGFYDLDRSNIGINENAIKVDGVKTILLLGKDEGSLEGDEGSRSDVIILASINTNLKTFKLISIPRDTQVDIPGEWTTKINAAYFYGGPELALRTINSNFDLNVDDYVIIDYDGVSKLVDAVDGIDLELNQDEIDFINERIEETVYFGKIESEAIILDAEPGMVHLNGVQAVTHARDRSSYIDEYNRDDFGRANRQRNIIQEVATKAQSQPINQLMDIAKSLLSAVQTSLGKDKILGYILEFGINSKSYTENMKSYQNPSYETNSISGAEGTELIPDMELTKELFNKYINEE